MGRQSPRGLETAPSTIPTLRSNGRERGCGQRPETCLRIIPAIWPHPAAQNPQNVSVPKGHHRESGDFAGIARAPDRSRFEPWNGFLTGRARKTPVREKNDYFSSLAGALVERAGLSPTRNAISAPGYW
jgi:hypothetical protein